MTDQLPPRLAGPGLADLWSRCWKAMAKVGHDAWPSVTLDAVLLRAGDGWGLVRTVEAAGGPLPDRAGETRAQLAAVAAARDTARAELGDAPWVEAWLRQLGGGMLTRLHRRGELDLLGSAARVLAVLPEGGVPLPALASRLTERPAPAKGARGPTT